MGEYYLQLFDLKTEKIWILYCVIYMAVFYVTCMTLGFLLNGFEANELAIRRCTGYCEQMDIHSEASTIREALTFSAFLRQDSNIPDSVKYDSVEECLTLLDMHDIADQIIRGSSTEQMKRLTIGVELAAQPSVLFLDEPTSGLDARSAKVIMDGVRKVADSGLPARNFAFAAKYNPATWMLECIGAGVSNNSADGMDFVSKFEASEQKQKLDHALSHEGIGVPSPDTAELTFARKRAASSLTQMYFLVKRFLDMYWRSPTYNLTRIGMSVFLALLFGVTFTQAKYETYQGLNSGMGMLFMSTLFNGMISFQCVLSVAAADRPAFYRERASQTYNAFWYFVGSTIVEIPYVFGGTLVYTAIFFPMVQFTGFYTFVMYWINTSLLILRLTYMGQMFVYLLPSEEVAGIIGILVNSVFFLFMGFSPPANLIPQGYKWLYTITPMRFSLAILGALVFADCPHEPVYDESSKTWNGVGSELGCQPLQNAPVSTGPVTVKHFTEDVFGMKHDEIWSNLFVTIGFIGIMMWCQFQPLYEMMPEDFTWADTIGADAVMGDNKKAKNKKDKNRQQRGVMSYDASLVCYFNPTEYAAAMNMGLYTGPPAEENAEGPDGKNKVPVIEPVNPVEEAIIAKRRIATCVHGKVIAFGHFCQQQHLLLCDRLLDDVNPDSVTSILDSFLGITISCTHTLQEIIGLLFDHAIASPSMRRQLLTENIMHVCVAMMLDDEVNPQADIIEAACGLLNLVRGFVAWLR
ncbi:unnamed protein product [Phytophthora lilii]|uniref:Unnamed protein product n=1 Tax=Phytophthora lilii TaxID=2077276 RepID=A0A9W6XBT5_9STRA|nr:unnamed protein product [Phytophthora lilii]